MRAWANLGSHLRLPREPSPGTFLMLARVVENVYWLSRYLERAENTARIIGVNTNLLLDLPGGIAPGWLPLVDSR